MVPAAIVVTMILVALVVTLVYQWSKRQIAEDALEEADATILRLRQENATLAGAASVRREVGDSLRVRLIAAIERHKWYTEGKWVIDVERITELRG